jgi:hypothetical protein
MKSITLLVENSVADYVARVATLGGVSFEEAAADLLREGVKARARIEGKALLAELRDRSTCAPSEEEAISLAVEEQRAMRAERRASGRPP